MGYNYYTLHFHMKSSGIKIVIENLMKAFSRYTRIPFALVESGKQNEYKAPNKISHIKISELDYDDKVFNSYEALEKKANSLMKEIEEQLDFSKLCVLHAHNANLFKNSYLPTALKMLAQAHPKDLLLLLQVHDFAEEHRSDRLELLLNCTGKKDQKLTGKLEFPLTPNTVYLTINSRDKRLLKHIGIPSERIFVFSNAVNTEFFQQNPIKNERLLELIANYAKENSYYFSKNRKIILYPVKLIRRKNVVEALLVLKLLNSIRDEYQLLITLDANTKDDVVYSDMIKKYVKKNKLPVTIGFGFDVISSDEKREKDSKGNVIKYTLADLFSHAQSIITTSEREGFGFAFVEGWLANKEITGRKLSVVQEDFEKTGIEFRGFYNHMIVNGKDFVSYPYKEQMRLLDSVKMEELPEQEEVRRFIRAIKKPNQEVIDRNKKIIANKYSLRGYIKKLQKIIDSSRKLMQKKIEAEVNNKYLMDYFSTEKEKLVIISDMDGTFLDSETYSFAKSYKAYKKAIAMSIPVCFCTSKSFPEMEYFIGKLRIKHPFIAENGSAIYVPKRYFSFKIKGFDWSRNYNVRNITEHQDYDVIELNVTHKETYETLKKIQTSLDFPIKIYTDQSIEELIKITHMPEHMAKYTKIKFYADGCRIPNINKRKIEQFTRLAAKYGYTTKIGDRFVGINKGCDKGKATQILLELFQHEYKRIMSIGIGNSPNDFPMLNEVDFGYLVAKEDGKQIDTKDSDIEKVDAIGPEGWSKVVRRFLTLLYSKKKSLLTKKPLDSSLK